MAKNKINYKYTKAITLIEILLVIVIISSVFILSDVTNSISHYYYKSRADLIISKFKNIISFAKNSALISNTTTSICPIEYREYETNEYNKNKYIKYRCTNNWNNPIAIFYDSNKNSLLKNSSANKKPKYNNKINHIKNNNNKYNNYTDFNIEYRNIIFKLDNLLLKTEKIVLKKFNSSNKISFDPSGENNSINGTLYYNNLYYNKKIIINRVGRTR